MFKLLVLSAGLAIAVNAASAADICQTLWSGADENQVVAISETIALTAGDSVVGELFSTDAVGKVMLQMVGKCDSVTSLPGSNRTPAGFGAFALRMAGLAASGENPEFVSTVAFQQRLRTTGFPLTWGGAVERKPVTTATADTELLVLRDDISAYQRSTEENHLAFSEGLAGLTARVSEIESLGLQVDDLRSSLSGRISALEAAFTGQQQGLDALRTDVAAWRSADEVTASAQNRAIAANEAAIGTINSRISALEAAFTGQQQGLDMMRADFATHAAEVGVQLSEKLDASQLTRLIRAELLNHGLINQDGTRVSDANAASRVQLDVANMDSQ